MDQHHLEGRVVPWLLLLAGALILYVLGYRFTDSSATFLMAILTALAGGFWLRGWLNRSRRPPLRSVK